ncbi:uncharacterized protein [Paramormyrops kingsleyae]|uniref:uncharacterized protein n=1 Tax=Paramormyrops kingsleyae TaxID=1676925 RepID=UPI003B96C121
MATFGASPRKFVNTSKRHQDFALRIHSPLANQAHACFPVAGVSFLDNGIVTTWQRCSDETRAGGLYTLALLQGCVSALSPVAEQLAPRQRETGVSLRKTCLYFPWWHFEGGTVWFSGCKKSSCFIDPGQRGSEMCRYKPMETDTNLPKDQSHYTHQHATHTGKHWVASSSLLMKTVMVVLSANFAQVNLKLRQSQSPLENRGPSLSAWRTVVSIQGF